MTSRLEVPADRVLELASVAPLADAGSYLAGRQSELSVLSQAMTASGVEAQFVAVGGARWVGKTALLAAAVKGAVRNGSSIAWGFPARTRAIEPLSIFTGALRDHVRRRACRGVPETDDCLSAVAALRRQIVAADDSTQHRFRAFEGVRSLIERFASGRPLVLVLDDAHNADPLSVEMIEYLLGHQPDAPILTVMANRPVGCGPRLAKVLHHAASPCAEIQLADLGWLDCQGLFIPDMNAADRRLAYDAVGGNPGMLRALSAAWRTMADGFAHYTVDDLRTAVPPLLPTDLLVELESLSADALLLAAAAAVCGDPVNIALLCSVAEVDEETALAGIDELCDAEVLRATSPGHYEFRDLIIRALSYHRVGVSWRHSAHRRAAAALENAGADNVRLALQLEQFVEPGDPASASLLVEGAKETLLTSGTRAERWLRVARSLAPSDDPADVALHHGKTLVVVGRLAEGRRLLSDLVHDHAGHQAPPYLAEAAEWYARSSRLLGRYSQARTTVLRALTALSGHQEVDTTGLELELAATTLSLDPADIDWEQSVGAAEHHDDVSRRAHALAQRAIAMTARQQHDEAFDLARMAAFILDRCSDDEVTGQLEALRWLAEAESLLGHHDQAAQHFGRALRLADQRAHKYLSAFLSVGLGWVQLRLGDVDSAWEQAERAGTAADLSVSDPMRAAALGLKSQVLVAMGRQAAGADAATLAIRFSDGLRDSWAGYARNCLQEALSAVPRGLVEVPRHRGPTAEPVTESPSGLLNTLSRRESEIAQLVSVGRTNQQIARALTLSPKTVETYLARTFHKLDITSRSQIAHLVGLTNGH